MTKKINSTLNKVLPKVPKYLAIATAVLAAIAAILLAIVGVIPPLYLVIIGTFGAVGLWFTLSPLIKNKASKKQTIALSIVAVFISIISISMISFSLSLQSFLNGIQQDPFSEETYSMIAEKDRSMTTRTAKSAGLVKTDPYIEASRSELKNHTSAKQEELPTTSAAMTALEADDIDLSVLNSANLQLAKESDGTFDDKFEIIGTFKIKVASGTQGSPKVATTKPFIVYISGIDTYGAISSVSRSDVNMLAVVNPETRQLLLVNTPRDYYVQLNGTTGTKDKLTHAGIYGVDKSRKTMEDLYQVEIPFYLRVNFSSLVTIVDSLGGINVYSDYAFKSFHEGYNQLDGKAALEFSRERYSFEEGDRQRGRNQQRVIEAIVSKMSTPGALVNYQSVLSSVQGAVQTNIPAGFITGLASNQIKSGKGWSTKSISVDGTGSKGPTYSMGAQQLYIMIPNESSLSQARATIQQNLK